MYASSACVTPRPNTPALSYATSRTAIPRCSTTAREAITVTVITTMTGGQFKCTCIAASCWRAYGKGYGIFRNTSLTLYVASEFRARVEAGEPKRVKEEQSVFVPLSAVLS